ncbi:MAG TPA: hypothetical protein VNG93_07450, partial [Candidatus Dormibacteraeota bacterium]|nr:hypothetical protein [Candidatus Dormibacteraeota bacterium]
MPRAAAVVMAGLLLAACGGGAHPRPAEPSPSASTPPSPRAAASPSPIAQLGPGSLTLAEEVGAVIMAGFQGPATDSVLADWRQRQFGGLLVVNLNHNASSPDQMTAFVAAVRAANRHR